MDRRAAVSRTRRKAAALMRAVMYCREQKALYQQEGRMKKKLTIFRSVLYAFVITGLIWSVAAGRVPPVYAGEKSNTSAQSGGLSEAVVSLSADRATFRAGEDVIL